jgi:hypothetical protein
MMNGLISGVLNVCLLLAETVIAIGLLVALARVALGHRRAYAQLVGVAIAFLVVVLWQRGELGEVVQGMAGMFTTAARSQSPGLPWSTPTPGVRP